jgi:hypothetical protein
MRTTDERIFHLLMPQMENCMASAPNPIAMSEDMH